MNIFSDLYERRKTHPAYWHNKASDLFASAGVLWKAMHDPNHDDAASELGFSTGFSFGVACWPVYQMLCGMAFELLFKAIIVAKGQRPQTNHKLVALSQDAGVAMTDTQLRTLKILSESVIWDGRYPVPKDERHFHELNELHWEHLYDPVPGMAIKLKRPNDRLSWKSIRELWDLVYDVYWAHSCSQG